MLVQIVYRWHAVWLTACVDLLLEVCGTGWPWRLHSDSCQNVLTALAGVCPHYMSAVDFAARYTIGWLWTQMSDKDDVIGSDSCWIVASNHHIPSDPGVEGLPPWRLVRTGRTMDLSYAHRRNESVDFLCRNTCAVLRPSCALCRHYQTQTHTTNCIFHHSWTRQKMLGSW